MTCAIMQPTYLPWLGYFDMIDKVDIFVLYDDVQLAKRSWQVRNRINSSSGELMLTIPVVNNKSRDEIMINEALINYSEKCVKKHLASFRQNYSKAPFFDLVYAFFEERYKQAPKCLSELTGGIIKDISKMIGIHTEIIYSSSIKSSNLKKDYRLVELAKSLKCDSYLSAKGSGEYIEAEQPGGAFTKSGVLLYYHNYSHPVYEQNFNGFRSYLGIIDLLFNKGFDESLEVIRSGRTDNISVEELRKELGYVN